jgi:pyruvate dehydrogenase E2 component (dihydrolipoamide acetyltransferase)
MAREFHLPDPGEGLVEAEIVRWLVPVGGEVQVDQPIVEVETDKAVIELPSPYAGVLIHQGAAEGEVLSVGEVLAVIGDPGEIWASPGSPAAVRGDAPADPHDEPGVASAPSGANAAPIVGSLSEEAQDLPPRQLRTDGNHGIRALPKVRRLARSLDLDLGAVPGTGSSGEVTADDVLSAARPAPADPSAGVAPRPSADTTGHSRRRRLGSRRRAIAARMVESWREIPQVTAFDQVEATRMMSARAALQARHGVPVPVDALVVAALAPALRAFPDFNATLDGDDLVVHERQDIGIAVDAPDGLLVAVIRDAGSRGVLDLAAEVRRLGEQARARTLTPADLSGQTFTVSNIGAVGGSGHGTPLVPPGTTAIVSVGRASDAPVAHGGMVEVTPIMPLSLSYDHRVIDGALGRRFLAVLVENLAEPALFLT